MGNILFSLFEKGTTPLLLYKPIFFFSFFNIPIWQDKEGPFITKNILALQEVRTIIFTSFSYFKKILHRYKKKKKKGCLIFFNFFLSNNKHCIKKLSCLF